MLGTQYIYFWGQGAPESDTINSGERMGYLINEAEKIDSLCLNSVFRSGREDRASPKPKIKPLQVMPSNSHLPVYYRVPVN